MPVAGGLEMRVESLKEELQLEDVKDPKRW
jgi:hypothetical protein